MTEAEKYMLIFTGLGLLVALGALIVSIIVLNKKTPV